MNHKLFWNIVQILILTGVMILIFLWITSGNPRRSALPHPTGDYCSAQGDFMFYWRKVSGPDSCPK